MRRLVVDASVLAAVCFGEPGGEVWAERLDGAAVFAPSLLAYELESVARQKSRALPNERRAVLRALALALDPARGLTCIDPDPLDVVLMAEATGLTTYDASYLCLAGMLEADLLTADTRLAAALDPNTEPPEPAPPVAPADSGLS